MTTIPQEIAALAVRYGDRPALVGGGETMSFAELDRAATVAARAFLAAGVEHGERIGIWAPNRCDWVVAAAGAQRIGGVLVPLNTRLRGPEVAALVRRADIRLLVSVGDFLGQYYPGMLRGETMPGLRRIVVLGDGPVDAAADEQAWEAFLMEGAHVDGKRVAARAAAVRPEDLADIMFTSGTTGLPKGAMFDHARTLRGAREYAAAIRIRPDDRFCVFGPFSHQASYKLGWLTGLLQGISVHWPESDDAESLSSLFAEQGVTITALPPTLIGGLLLQPDRTRRDLAALRYISTGATMIPAPLIEQLSEVLPNAQLATGYGMTECCGTATLTDVGDGLEIVSRTVGKPLVGTEIRCVDQTGRDVPPGEIGEVLVRNARLLIGYLDDPAATAVALDADGWYHSGDIGALDARGHLRITDRLKDMFIVGGFNVYPAEVERSLLELPGVQHCAVVGVPDARLGEVGHAFIVRSEGSALQEGDVFGWCRARIANYKAPRGVTFLDALPLNATGKVMKPLLRQMLG